MMTKGLMVLGVEAEELVVGIEFLSLFKDFSSLILIMDSIGGTLVFLLLEWLKRSRMSILTGSTGSFIS